MIKQNNNITNIRINKIIFKVLIINILMYKEYKKIKFQNSKTINMMNHKELILQNMI